MYSNKTGVFVIPYYSALWRGVFFAHPNLEDLDIMRSGTKQRQFALAMALYPEVWRIKISLCLEDAVSSVIFSYLSKMSAPVFLLCRRAIKRGFSPKLPPAADCLLT